MKKTVRETIKDANDTGVSLLFTDLGLAHTLLERAEKSRDAETRLRNMQHVARACASVTHFMGKLQITNDDRISLIQKVEALEQRLATLRPNFS